MTINSGYLPEPEAKRKTRKPAKPNAARTLARKTSKPATAQTAKPKASKKPKRVRLTPEERQERAQARAAEKRRKLQRAGFMQTLPATCNTRTNPLLRLHRETSQVTRTSPTKRQRPGQLDRIIRHHAPGQLLTADCTRGSGDPKPFPEKNCRHRRRTAASLNRYTNNSPESPTPDTIIGCTFSSLRPPHHHIRRRGRHPDPSIARGRATASTVRHQAAVFNPGHNFIAFLPRHPAG